MILSASSCCILFPLFSASAAFFSFSFWRATSFIASSRKLYYTAIIKFSTKNAPKTTEKIQKMSIVMSPP